MDQVPHSLTLCHLDNMYSTQFVLSFAFCFIIFIKAQEDSKTWQIYYDHKTNQSIPTISKNDSRLVYYKVDGLPSVLIHRIGFGPIPCSCKDLTCGCCAGMNIQTFQFNQRACMNFTYDPDEFSLKMNMLWNDESIYSPSISGKNPPPVCMPMPIPYIPQIDLCVRFFNIYTPGYNINMCLDFETRIERAPVFVLHFDCLVMGADGIHYVKPDDTSGGLDVEDADPGVQNAEEPEIYDEVTEERGKAYP